MNETEFLKRFHSALIAKGWKSFPQNSNVAPGSRYIPGTPDLIACSPGGFFFGFELKMARGVLSDSQKKIMFDFTASGLAAHYQVVRSNEDWPSLIENLSLSYGKKENS